LVEATPISGPARVRSVPSHSRVMLDPTTLQMEMAREPRRLASLTAASVSAVSPDWVTASTSVFSSTSGSR
jgi:hypothetical protein